MIEVCQRDTGVKWKSFQRAKLETLEQENKLILNYNSKCTIISMNTYSCKISGWKINGSKETHLCKIILNNLCRYSIFKEEEYNSFNMGYTQWLPSKVFCDRKEEDK